MAREKIGMNGFGSDADAEEVAVGGWDLGFYTALQSMSTLQVL
jgi:hypothetical protein